jgi:acyl-CoA thioesterase I
MHEPGSSLYYGIQMLRNPWIAASIATLALLCGCRQPETAPKPAPSSTPPPTAAPAAADARRAIVCFGDSITAGFGLDTGQSFPDLLQQELDRRGLAYRIVNLGVSGDTTQDGLARVFMALAEKPSVVVLELGGNDGLRGIPISITQANLARMIEQFQGAGARVVLAGMSLPPNYGPAYVPKFEALYRDLAAKYKLTLIPFLLEGVGAHDELMQRDGIHPNAAGARQVETLVMKSLGPLLK